MPARKATKYVRRKNATRKQRKSRRQRKRKSITHSRRRRVIRTTRRIRRGGDRNAIYGKDAAEEAYKALNDPEILLSECINDNCQTETTKWADDWALVKGNQRLMYTYMPTINESRANMAKACTQCDTKLGLIPGTTLTAAIRNVNSASRPSSQ